MFKVQDRDRDLLWTLLHSVIPTKHSPVLTDSNIHNEILCSMDVQENIFQRSNAAGRGGGGDCSKETHVKKWSALTTVIRAFEVHISLYSKIIFSAGSSAK